MCLQNTLTWCELHFVDNIWDYYLANGEVSPGVQGDPIGRGEVVQDFSTSWVALCAIYFPSVTGEICV